MAKRYILEKLSEQVNRVARRLPSGTSRTAGYTAIPDFPQTDVLTAPQILALRTVTKLLQLVAWLLLIAYRNISVSPTPY